MMNLSECVDDSCLQNGVHLRLGVLHMYTLCHIMRTTETGAVEIDGIYSKMVPFMLSGLNITYEYRTPESNDFEQLLPNGSWTGTLGMLQRNEIDINIGPTSIEESRFNDFRSLEAYQFSSVSLLAAVGKVNVNNFFTFLFKIDSIIWYTIIFAFSALVVTSAMCEAFNYDSDFIKNFAEGIDNNFWVYLASFFCEGSPRMSNSRRSQALLFMWLFCVLIISNALTSQFKAVLMVKHDGEMMRTVEDVANRDDIEPMFLAQTVLESAFSGSPLEHYRRLYQKALDNPEEALIDASDFASPDTYQRIKDGEIVMTTEEKVTKAILTLICGMLNGGGKFYFVEETVYPIQGVSYIRYDFPKYLLEKINDRLMKMKEAGIYEKWLEYYSKDYGKCEEEEEQDYTPLGWHHLNQIFYLLLLCHTISFTVALLERFVKAACRRKRQHVDKINIYLNNP